MGGTVYPRSSSPRIARLCRFPSRASSRHSSRTVGSSTRSAPSRQARIHRYSHWNCSRRAWSRLLLRVGVFPLGW